MHTQHIKISASYFHSLWSFYDYRFYCIHDGASLFLSSPLCTVTITRDTTLDSLCTFLSLCLALFFSSLVTVYFATKRTSILASAHCGHDSHKIHHNSQRAIQVPLTSTLLLSSLFFFLSLFRWPHIFCTFDRLWLLSSTCWLHLNRLLESTEGECERRKKKRTRGQRKKNLSMRFTMFSCKWHCVLSSLSLSLSFSRVAFRFLPPPTSARVKKEEPVRSFLPLPT